LRLDIVPIVFNITANAKESVTKPNLKHAPSQNISLFASGAHTPRQESIAAAFIQLNAISGKLPVLRTLDEQADSAARKCVMYFGPGNNPRLSIGARNHVQVDAGGKIHLIDDIEEYRKTVSKGTWNCVMRYADELRERKVKIAFFSSTPQGKRLFLTSKSVIDLKFLGGGVALVCLPTIQYILAYA
jgi:alpha,alpha-trehalose phosphorylase (configuration-retaining)